MGNRSIIQKIIDEYMDDEIEYYEFEHMMMQEGCAETYCWKIRRDKQAEKEYQSVNIIKTK